MECCQRFWWVCYVCVPISGRSESALFFFGKFRVHNICRIKLIEMESEWFDTNTREKKNHSQTHTHTSKMWKFLLFVKSSFFHHSLHFFCVRLPGWLADLLESALCAFSIENCIYITNGNKYLYIAKSVGLELVQLIYFIRPWSCPLTVSYFIRNETVFFFTSSCFSVCILKVKWNEKQTNIFFFKRQLIEFFLLQLMQLVNCL